MPEPTRDQLLGALRKADAAGDTEAARAIARRIASMDEASGEGLDLSSAPITDDSPIDSLIPTADQFKQGLAEGFGDLIEGVSSLPGLIINPVGQALYDATGYSDHTYDLGDILRGAVDAPESAPGIGRAMRQGTAAALTGAGAARAVSTAVTSPVAKNALLNLGRTPVRDAVSGGAAAGAGEVGHEIGGVPGQVVGTVVGGLAGYSGANALAKGFTPSAPNALAQSATRQGVDLLPADAGGAVTKAVTTGTKASPLSVAPVVNQAKRQQGQMASAARRIAEAEGEIVTTDAAGEAIRSGAKEFTKQTTRRGARLYDRAAEMAKSVKAITPKRTIDAVDEAIARLEANPAAEASALKQLRSFREKIGEGVSIQGLRDARTSLSQGVYDGQLRGGADQKMWKDILGNVSDDIDDALRGAGLDGAADAFRAADDFWKSRVQHIDDVLQPIIGKDGAKGGEQIVQAIESMSRGARGGNARLSRLLAGMTDAEAGNVRATIVDRIGKATPGAQDAAGEAFSASTFLTNWNKMTPQAKASLFPTKEMRRDLDDLARLAEGMKASQAMANFSNTGVAIGANAGGAAALAIAHPGLAASAATAQYLTGRLMASPAFARVLARTSKLPPEVAGRKLSEQLGVLAAREPLIANDVKALQQAINDNVGVAAAAEEPSQ